jgi:hypothetical protein
MVVLLFADEGNNEPRPPPGRVAQRGSQQAEDLREGSPPAGG